MTLDPRLPMRRDVFAEGGALPSQTESVEPSPKHARGAICAQWVRCGRPWCHCMHDGPKHGPYYAQFWWQDGRRRKRYVRQQDAAQVVVACAERRTVQRERRAVIEATRQEWRELRTLIREVERGER
jgi:hypothetical protein